nr:Shedu immune nuclease family protein [Agrobacterium leguminum]
MRQSDFNQRERADGGPFLHIYVPGEEANFVEVYISDSDDPSGGGDSRLLLRIFPDALFVHPIHVGQGSKNYLQPKYGSLTEVVIPRSTLAPYKLPQTVDDVDELLSSLPKGFETNWRLGLGLLYEYRLICRSVASIPGVNTLVVHGQSGERDAIIRLPEYVLGIKRFHELRREITRTTTHFRREARLEKQRRVHKTLLQSADPVRFPPPEKKIKPDSISDLTKGGTVVAGLSKRDRRAAVRLVQGSVATLAKSEPQTLLALKSEIELVTLQQLIERFQEMLGKDLPEARWQEFLKSNPFILSMAFSAPAIMIQENAYVGGKQFYGGNGKFADFLMATASSGNLALVEIKKPHTDLLTKTAYRGADVFPPSQELSGAVYQVLDQQSQLHKNLLTFKDEIQRNDIHAHSIQCIVIAGKTPELPHLRKSFEIVRNSYANVTIITFDELCARLIEIQKALSPPVAKDISTPWSDGF